MFEYHHPVKIVFGAGSLEQAGQAAATLGKKALIACDPFAITSGLAEKLSGILTEAKVASVVYDKVIPNPTAEIVDAGGDLAVREQCDVIIGLGGGSSMDTAKAIAVAATHEGPIWPYAIYEKEPTAATLPIMAITTTSGTGSQCTPFSVISNPETKQKPGFGGPYLFPKIALVDPELMLTMPRRLTATTGFDVFSHAVEAFTSQWASPITDMYAKEAISLVAQHFHTALDEPGNIDARKGMALADTFAGIAISHGGVSLAHVMAHVISGHYEDIAHGDALYSIYAETLRFNAPGDAAKHRWIAETLRPGCDDAAKAFEEFFPSADFANLLYEKRPDDAIITTIADETFSYMELYARLGPVEPSPADAKAILKASLRG